MGPVLEGGEEGPHRQLLLLLLHLVALPARAAVLLVRGPRLEKAEAVDGRLLLPLRPQALPHQVWGQGRQPLPPAGHGDFAAAAAAVLLPLLLVVVQAVAGVAAAALALDVVVAAEGVEGLLAVPPHLPEEQGEALRRRGRGLWGRGN